MEGTFRDAFGHMPYSVTIVDIVNKPVFHGLVHSCDAVKHLTFTYGKKDGHEWL